MKENEIRTILADNLSTFFPELTLVEVEFYLPKTKGTRGYIDILATHKKGNYVIIELKRSENSSRQAIHEIIKYSEGLKEKFSLKNSEIELYIISTLWNELLIPFSSFKVTSSNQVFGFKLVIDDSKKITIESVEALKLAGDRLFSPYQTCRHYSSQKTLKDGISEHKEINQERGLLNFVLIILKSPKIDKNELISHIAQCTKTALEATGIEYDESNSPLRADLLPDSKFVIYQSYLRSPKEHYLELLKENPEYLNEIMQHIKDEEYNADDELNYLEEAALLNSGRFPKSEYVEYAYPSKFMHMIRAQGYEIVEIIKFGSLRDNEIINNEMIINEFEGLTGTEKVQFHGNAHSKSKSQLKEIFENSMKCVENNPIWSGHISHFFSLIDKEKINFTLSTTVYNPFNILISLFRCLKYQTNKFMPCYEINLQFHSESESNKLYYGIITWNGQKPPTLNSLIENYFDGDAFNLVSPLMWGGDINNNLNILNALGLKYSSILVESVKGQEPREQIFKDFEFSLIQEGKLETIYDFVVANIDLLLNLSSLIESHSAGENNEIVFNKRDYQL